MKFPNTYFSTPLSGSAKETQLRIRNIFQGAKKRPPLWLMALVALSILLCGSLVSCQKLTDSFALELTGYQTATSFEVRYPTGEVAASLPWEEALFGFPAVTPSQSWADDEGIPVFFGQNSQGLCWAVVCSGPSLGVMHTNILLSQDGGRNYTRIGDADDVFPIVVTGAGFLSPQHGFLCYRYYYDSGPTIYETQDGGQSWNPLILPVPNDDSNYNMTPRSPIITAQSICFPIDLYGEAGWVDTVYCSRFLDSQDWSWTTQY